MTLRIHQRLAADGFVVPLAKLCRWFGVPIKAVIEESPSFGYRTVAHLLGFNKNTVQRIF